MPIPSAHEWIEFGGCRTFPFRRLRICTCCHRAQSYESRHEWMRVVGYTWAPKATRCTGIDTEHESYKFAQQLAFRAEKSVEQLIEDLQNR